MARIVGVNLPENERIGYALTGIFGIGVTKAKEICFKSKVDESKKVRELTEEERKKIQDIIEKEYTVEGQLREEIRQNIKRLVEIGSYRGIRHSKMLPVRGQRTRSNARTKRGKRKTVGAYKKEDIARMKK